MFGISRSYNPVRNISTPIPIRKVDAVPRIILKISLSTLNIGDRGTYVSHGLVGLLFSAGSTSSTDTSACGVGSVHCKWLERRGRPLVVGAT